MKNFYVILGAVAVIGLAVVMFAVRGGGFSIVFWNTNWNTKKSGSAASEPVDLGEIADSDLVALAQGVVYGDPDAPITILEFVNYQCPSCQVFAFQVKPQVDLAYIQSGQAKLVLHDFPTAGLPHSFVAARAVRCAGDQDRYFDYHDEIFRTLREWSSRSSPVGHFKDLADDLDMDAQAFDACIDSDRHADVVTANLQLGIKLRVTGTPNIFVHDGGPPFQKLGGFQFLDIQQAVEAISQN